MNVKFNTIPQNNSNFNQSNQRQIAFKANPAKVTEDLVEIAKAVEKKKSSFFDPILKKYDEFTDGIAKHVTSRFANSSLIRGLSSKFRNSDKAFQHCLTTDSVITSGLYMYKTLNNEKLDKDRKQTLAVNQGLTLVLSTIGAYSLDKYVKGWWSKVTEKYAGILLKDNGFVNNFHEHNNKIKESNKKLLEAVKGKNEKPLLKDTLKLEEFVENHISYKNLDVDGQKSLMSKIKGMSVLRAMLVFGFVYRYFVPVVVTKPSNKLCDMYLEHKKAKQEQSAQKA